MIRDFLSSDENVFILKGYAGTGKTTILKGIVEYLKEMKTKASVMAPTGRAAKVLRDKTGMGVTIHRGIYSFTDLHIEKNLNHEDENDVDFHYYFPVIDNDQNDNVYIVDEASMISDKISRHELFTFGTGRLLYDLLTFVKFPSTKNKLILVGDPAQLPPVTDSESLALNEKYFTNLQLKIKSFEMREVVRQQKDSLILKNAMKLRDLLAEEKRFEWQLETDNKEIIPTNSEDVAHVYTRENPVPKIGNSVVISYSNLQCLSYNQSIREQYFPDQKTILPGDIVMINNNNYYSYETELYNGDLAQVVYVSEVNESQSAPVWISQGGIRKRVIITLHFRDIVIRLPHFENDIHCKFIKEVLNSPFRDLSINEMKALFINFRIRFFEMQAQRKKQGLPEIKVDSDEYKNMLRNDPYYNAIRIKYGYAITCHKAQGGEWENAFVNFTGMVGLSNNHLRWGYTAITRAKKKLRVINPPNIGMFDKLRFTDIKKLGKIPSEAIHFGFLPETPYHNHEAHPAKRAKYYEILEKLEDTPYKINRVESRPYLEIYYFSGDNGEIRCDTIHNLAGLFNPFTTDSASETVKDILRILNNESSFVSNINYTPGNELLNKLYSQMQVNCSEAGVVITNIVEYIINYHVYYFLKASGKYAYLQFYFNGKGEVSYVNVMSDIGHEDEKLIHLIKLLEKCHLRK